MPSRRSPAAKMTAQDVQRLRTMLQRNGAEPGTVDDLVRGVVGNQSRREFVDDFIAWCKALPKEAS